MRFIARQVLVEFKPFSGKLTVCLHARCCHNKHKILAAGNMIELLHFGQRSHLSLEIVELLGGRGHAQCNNARDWNTKNSAIELRNLRADRAVLAQTF